MKQLNKHTGGGGMGIMASRMFGICAVFITLVLVTTPVLANPRPFIESTKNLPDNHTSAVELAKAIVPEHFHYCIVSAEFEGSDEQNEIFKKGLLFGKELQGFPTEGDAYVVLSTGRASDAPGKAEEFVSTAVENGIYIPSGSPNGYDAYDVTTLRIKLRVPEFANYLMFQYKFGTEENPSFVGTEFQDFFRAIVITPDGHEHVLASLTVDSAAEISNKVTGASENPQPPFPEPNDVTYNAVTKLLTAKFDVRDWRGEEITVIFQVGDASDPIYDSAVFLDNLNFLPSTTQSLDWPMLYHDERNTCLSGSKLPSKVNLEYIKPVKTVGVLEDITHPPIVIGDKIIVVTRSVAPKETAELLASLAWLKVGGVLKELGGLLGKAIDLVDVIDAIRGVSNPTMYTIHCLDVSSGNELWNRTIPAFDIHIAASQEGVFVIAEGIATNLTNFPGVYCFDLSGHKKWYHPFVALTTNGLILSDNKLFFDDEIESPFVFGHYLHCFDISNGEEISPYPVKISSSLIGPPAVAYNKVFIATDDDTIHCLDEETGEELWSQKIKDEELKTHPIMSGVKIYVVTFNSSNLLDDPYSIYSLDINTRDVDVIWKGSLRPYLVVSATGDVIVYRNNGLELVKSGKQWNLQGGLLEEVKSVIASIDNKALIFTTYEKLISLDLNNPEVLWEIDLSKYISHAFIIKAEPVLANENIFVALHTDDVS